MERDDKEVATLTRIGRFRVSMPPTEMRNVIREVGGKKVPPHEHLGCGVDSYKL